MESGVATRLGVGKVFFTPGVGGMAKNVSVLRAPPLPLGMRWRE